MILLGIILLALGFLLFRPLVWVGGVLILIGVILWVAHAGAYGTWPYVPSG